MRVLPKKLITQIGVTRLRGEMCEGATKETHYSDYDDHTSNLNTIRNYGSAQQLTFTLDLDVNYGSLPEV